METLLLIAHQQLSTFATEYLAIRESEGKDKADEALQRWFLFNDNNIFPIGG